MSPRNHFLPLVTGTAKLVMRAIEMGARLIVVDTSGLIDGVAGQMLKLTKAELCRPHHVVALHHGGELEPIAGVLERFLSLDVISLGRPPRDRRTAPWTTGWPTGRPGWPPSWAGRAGKG